ncbi:FAD-dependent oxidoreductase [Fulvivirgaceae bacterium BMA10]|uniref:FAD-dependent oxidoreductase n=1 Tax=Splendidivirga corallicola TaxID=3051826 RepID=A0ABT8KK26_9BACT|nr:FAD-dependent oxidoreductase [Fulvivirgaceae bacterium BMA10]
MQYKEPDKTADVIIIGAGAIGCAAAYYLSKKRIGKIILLERNSIGSGNTSWAASLLTKTRSKTALIPLVEETYRSIAMLEEESGHDLGMQQIGSLHVASSEKSKKDLDKLLSIAHQFQIPNRVVDNHELKEMVPWIAKDEIEKAAYMEEDAYLEAYVLTSAFAEAARKNGVQILQQANVTELLREGDKVIGVRTENEFITSKVVVDAAGAWANILSTQVGVALPMAPVRSNYWITSVNKEMFPVNQPIVVIPDASAYTRPESGALLFGLREAQSIYIDPKELPDDLNGYTFGNPEDRWNILLEQGENFKRFFPGFDSIEIPHYISGLSTYTPDGMFVLGGIPGVAGFMAATGCSGAGVAACGGIGRIISELVADETVFCDIENFKVDRFGSSRFNPFSKEFMQQCAAARSQKKSG